MQSSDIQGVYFLLQRTTTSQNSATRPSSNFSATMDKFEALNKTTIARRMKVNQCKKIRVKPHFNKTPCDGIVKLALEMFRKDHAPNRWNNKTFDDRKVVQTGGFIKLRRVLSEKGDSESNDTIEELKKSKLEPPPAFALSTLFHRKVVLFHDHRIKHQLGVAHCLIIKISLQENK